MIRIEGIFLTILRGSTNTREEISRSSLILVVATSLEAKVVLTQKEEAEVDITTTTIIATLSVKSALDLVILLNNVTIVLINHFNPHLANFRILSKVTIICQL